MERMPTSEITIQIRLSFLRFRNIINTGYQVFNLKAMIRFAINIILLVLLIAAGYAAYNLGYDAWQSWLESHSIKQQIEELTKKKNNLEAYLAELKTVEAVKREAKERFNLKLPGEEVAVVVSSGSSTFMVTTTPASWPSRFRDFFRSLF